MSQCGDYYVMAHLMVYKSSKLLCRDKQTHTDNKILYYKTTELQRMFLQIKYRSIESMKVNAKYNGVGQMLKYKGMDGC